MERKSYTAVFKAKVVLELLRVERERTKFAAEHPIAPNQLRNRKAKFLSNAELVLGRKRDRCLQEELQAKQHEANALVKRVGQQAIDFLNNLRNEVNLPRRVELLHEVRCDDNKPLTISLAAELLSVNRTSVYAESAGISDAEITAKRLIDVIHTDHPARGSRQKPKQLKAAGLYVDRLKTRRYMAEMGIHAFDETPVHRYYPALLEPMLDDKGTAILDKPA